MNAVSTPLPTVVGFLPLALLGVSALLSAASFALYGLDKSAARRGARRIPESTLHLLALAGGWPGALLGQRVFRHKTVKRRFRVVFWATVVANLAGVALLVGAGR